MPRCSAWCLDYQLVMQTGHLGGKNGCHRNKLWATIPLFISRHHRLAPTDVHSLFQYRYVRVSDLSPLFSVLGMDNVKHFTRNGRNVLNFLILFLLRIWTLCLQSLVRSTLFVRPVHPMPHFNGSQKKFPTPSGLSVRCSMFTVIWPSLLG